MVDAQPFFDKLVLQCDHVHVFVARKMRMEAVARLTGFAAADVVRKNQKVFVCVQKLAGTEELSSEDGMKKIVTAPTGAVKDQHRVGGAAGGVLNGRSERVVVEADFRRRLAGLEMEVVHDVITLRWSRPVL